MNVQEIGRKEIESEEFGFFAKAYEQATGRTFERITYSERPDFLCELDGEAVGVELTKIVGSPQEQLARDLFSNEIDPFDVLDWIGGAATQKAEKLKGPGWATPDSTILVIQLMDFPISDLLFILDDVSPDDFEGIGFRELWLVDYSEREAYQDAELFCLSPANEWGYFPRDVQKPFG